MEETIEKALVSAVNKFSDQDYAQSFAFYRFWSDIGQTYHQAPSDKISETLWRRRAEGSAVNLESGQLIHSTAHLILRFASDAESDHILAPHNSGLQSRLCTRSLRKFFDTNLTIVRYKERNATDAWTSLLRGFCEDTNFIAHWTNLGFVGEAAIRNHILQSLISHPELHDHQADALIVLFKLAGAAFEAHAGSSVVDRCLELLNDHYNHDSVKGGLVQVRKPHPVEGS